MRPITKDLSKTVGANTYESDLNYAIKVTRVILQIIGLWPIPKFASTTRKIAIRLQNIVCYSLIAFIVIPGFLLVFLKERSLKRKIRLMGPIFNTSLVCVKYTLLLIYTKNYQICLEQMRQDWRDTVDQNDRKMMLREAKTSRKFAICSAIFAYMGGLIYRTVMPFLNEGMLTSMNTTVRILPCPSYFIKFDEQASPAYEIVCFIQFFSGIVTYSITCGTAGLAALFIMHVCGRLSVLVNKLKRLNDMSKPEDRAVATLLADIVEQQLKVKSFLKLIEESMRYLWLIEIAGSTVLLCLVGYYIIMGWKNNDFITILIMFMTLFSFTFSIFIMCYAGQLLTDQSVKVALAISTLNWHRFPLKRARSLILMIAFSNNPEKIWAGKIIEMSLSTFGNIVQTSLTYFNLLRKFTI